MARKTAVSIQDSVEDNEELDAYLQTHANQLICMEVYSEFCGPCLATAHAVRKGKLEIGQDKIAMVKKGKLTRAMFGANGIELIRIIEEELGHVHREEETGVVRPKWDIEEMLPEEAHKIEEDRKMEEEYRDASERLRILTLAARKRRVCERLSNQVKRLNFIMFWPHCHMAHYDLYEKWDMININIAGKELVQLDEKGAKEALYMSDVEPNEACIHALFNGEVMVVLFKMFETDTRDFVALLRYTLYEEVPIPNDELPPEEQIPAVPPYERYATISKTAPEVRRDRYNAKLQKLREEKEERERLAAEQARMAREAEEERIREEKQRAEEERMRRIQAGLPAEPEPEPQPQSGPDGEPGAEVEPGAEQQLGTEQEPESAPEGEETEGEEKTETEATEEAPLLDDEMKLEEEKVEAEEEFNSQIEVEGEDYIPPGGLFVPGLYCPPNELAKANGLAFFFPKVVQQMANIESEHLPPHVLVIFPIDKRHDVQEVVNLYSDEVLAMGVFAYEGDDPFASEHVAYSIKQYDKMERIRKHKDRLALMVSRKRSLPLLQLAGLNPCYISADTASGERDCLQLFPVGYGDQFEEESSVVEEEIVELPPPPEPEPEVEPQNEQKEDDEEDEDEED